MAKYSIILPVRNGGEHVKECVASILAQTYTDFNLIILDNKSTDGTTKWIGTIADKRVTSFLSAESLSIEQNWERITRVSKNEFITLIGHDDILYPDYLSVMDQLIERHPDASLYQTHFTYIDVNGKHIRDCIPMPGTIKPAEFLEKFLRREIDLMGTGFMMRAKSYDALGGIPPLYPNLLFADFELWINLTKMNYLAVAPEVCFSFRIHASTTTVSGDDKYHRAFDKFIHFLKKIQIERTEFSDVIMENGPGFLLFYCRGLCHRLLRTPRKKRPDLSVRQTLSQCRAYAKALGFNNSFHPEKVFSIRLAKWIDSNMLSRSIFLTFKKIYRKPMIK